MISSKDDAATASLLGFAIANRVEPMSATANGENSTNTKSAKDENSKREDREGKGCHHLPGEKDGRAARKNKNSSVVQGSGSQSKGGGGGSNATGGKDQGHHQSNSKHNAHHTSHSTGGKGSSKDP